MDNNVKPTPRGRHCATCKHKEALYTCPRCHIKTCTMACANKHKEIYSCSGKRNKAAYVPMKDYTWGTLMDDYSYLESIGRQVSTWSKDIVGNGVGRGISSNIRRKAGKREGLQAHFRQHDIYMELLPLGMQKRSRNQSAWKPETSAISLTIQFTFHRYTSPPFTMLTHRNSTQDSLRELVRQRVNEAQCPSWVQSSALETKNIVFTMLRDPCQQSPNDRDQRQRLDSDAPLLVALSSCWFIEYPEVDVWQDLPDGWHESERPFKRQCVKTPTAASTVVSYRSDSSDQDQMGVLSAIAEYASGDELE